MRLQELLAKAPPQMAIASGPEWEGVEIQTIEYDSRQVQAGALFCAIHGAAADGHDYVPEAIARGARAIASERPALPQIDVPWLRTSDIRECMAVLAHLLNRCPSEALSLIGVTGTNGKTTTAYLIDSVLRLSGPSVLAGTIATRVGDAIWDSERTTPEAPDIQRLLHRAVDSGCKFGVLEVSSHALALQRVQACHFPVAVFTNLSQDHLDFHSSMEDYFQAKSLLFREDYNPGIRRAAFNGDDPWACRIDEIVKESLAFGLSSEAAVHPLRVEERSAGLRIELNLLGRRLEISSALTGPHNVYNIMAAASACHLMGMADEQIVRGLENLKSVPGRFERVQLEAPFDVFVDYAHTPHALENVLELCRQVSRGRVICVVGCGGDRDRVKRPQMGRIAAELSDWAILTSDNPRSESPERILQEMRSGIPRQNQRFETISDRREAIARSLKIADSNDLVLIAGKGHENYQEIHGRKIPFDDRQVAKEEI